MTADLVAQPGTTPVYCLAMALMAYFWQPGDPSTVAEWMDDAEQVKDLLNRVGLTLVNRPEHWDPADNLSHRARDNSRRVFLTGDCRECGMTVPLYGRKGAYKTRAHYRILGRLATRCFWSHHAPLPDTVRAQR